jgi:hypothetical protein
MAYEPQAHRRAANGRCHAGERQNHAEHGGAHRNGGITRVAGGCMHHARAGGEGEHAHHAKAICDCERRRQNDLPV